MWPLKIISGLHLLLGTVIIWHFATPNMSFLWHLKSRNMTSKRWNMTLKKRKNFHIKHRKSVLLGFIVDSSQFLLWKQSQMRIFRILLRFSSVKLCLLSVETFFGNFTYLFVCQNQNLIKYFAKTNPKNFQFPIYFLEKSWNFAKYVKNMTKIQNMTFGGKYDKSYDLHILI